MATKEFDKKFTSLLEDALHNSLEYTGYSSEIDCVYVYISLERGNQHLVFFKINGVLSLHGKLNEHTKKDYIDVSDDNQDRLNLGGNAIAREIRACFQEDDREVPTHMKIIHEPKSGKFDCKIDYNKIFDLEDADALTIYFRWFAEEGGTLES